MKAGLYLQLDERWGSGQMAQGARLQGHTVQTPVLGKEGVARA
jgi:hypothetical protein